MIVYTRFNPILIIAHKLMKKSFSNIKIRYGSLHLVLLALDLEIYILDNLEIKDEQTTLESIFECVKQLL